MSAQLECRRNARALISAVFVASLRNVENLRQGSAAARKISRPKLGEPPIPRGIDKSARECRYWNPITNGKQAIHVLINRVWDVPYAPATYIIQFLCTVHLARLRRHKYLIRWQNGRRSSVFYVNIDENEGEASSLWIHFPGEIKAQRYLSIIGLIL